MREGAADLSSIFLAREGRRRRASSFDRSGGNEDYFVLSAGETKPLADISGCGIVTHIWMTVASPSGEEFLLRKIVLRMYWDGEENPSAEVPLGDFFGMGHGMSRNFVSAPPADESAGRKRAELLVAHALPERGADRGGQFVR